jgi:NADH-quinone oxidoreductase subunit E
VNRDRLKERLQTLLGIRYGETTRDGRFTVLPIVCLGHCDHAPAMMVDEDLYGDVISETVEQILNRYP